MKVWLDYEELWVPTAVSTERKDRYRIEADLSPELVSRFRAAYEEIDAVWQEIRDHEVRDY